MEGLVDLLSNPLLNGVGVVVGAAGLIVALVIYLVSKREKRPVWSRRTTNLIDASGVRLPDFEVRYQDKRIDTLSVSRIAVWNAGKETIAQEDIAKGDPLRIEPAAGCRFMNAEVIATNSEASEADILVTGRVVHVVFDYLDGGHGLVVRIIHTGQSSADVVLSGAIRGAGQVDLIREPERRYPVLSYMVSLAVIAGMITMCGYLAWTIAADLATAESEKPDSLGAVLLGLVLLFGAGMLLGLRRELRRPVALPKGLEPFWTDDLDPAEQSNTR